MYLLVKNTAHKHTVHSHTCPPTPEYLALCHDQVHVLQPCVATEVPPPVLRMETPAKAPKDTGAD